MGERGDTGDSELGDRLMEARRRCEFDFAAMLAALDAGELGAAARAASDVERELKRFRREAEHAAQRAASK